MKGLHWRKNPDDAPATSPSDATVALDDATVTNDSPTGQRDTATLIQGASTQSRLQRTLALLLMAALGVGLLTWYYGNAFTRADERRTTQQKATARKADAETALPAIDFAKATAPVTPPAVAAAATPPAPSYLIGNILDDPTLAAAARNAPSRQTPATRSATAKTAAQLRQERLLQGEVFIGGGRTPARTAAVTADDLRTVPGTSTAFPAEPSDGAAAARAAAARAPASDLTPLLATTPIATARASLLPTRRLLLPKGAFIDCTLQTALDSSLPGMTTCLTAVDTFSADGNVVLLERGTTLIGETRGQVQHGSSRLFVLWTEARTPLGVVVPLASPGTDELGRSGLQGEVDRHFFERFGSAILVSVIDGVIQAGIASQTQQGGTVVVNSNSTQDVMTEVLRHTIAIPPTIRKAQGDRIQILVARDIDFRSVYALRGP